MTSSRSFSLSSPSIQSSSKNLPWYRCSKYSVILCRISRGSFRYAMYSSTCFTCTNGENNSFVINDTHTRWPKSTASNVDHFSQKRHTNQPTKVNRLRESAFTHQLPFHGIVFGWNLNSELNLSHDLRIMHSTWHQISSIASSATCRWAIAVEICQNRHSSRIYCSTFTVHAIICIARATYLPYPMHSMWDIALNNAHEYCSSQ